MSLRCARGWSVSRSCLSCPTTNRHPKRRGNIDSLTTGQRARLRSLAHPLKPIFQVGKDGITERAVTAVRDAFNTRELLKIKVLDSSPVGARAAGEQLAAHIDDAHLVQVIGRTVVLYRADPDDPRIDLERA